MHWELGSATLSQLAFPEKGNPNFPWEKSPLNNTDVKKEIFLLECDRELHSTLPTSQRFTPYSAFNIENVVILCLECDCEEHSTPHTNQRFTTYIKHVVYALLGV